MDIKKNLFERKRDGVWEQDPSIEPVFDYYMDKGPSYPLCAEPETMRRALFVLYEWFGEDRSCWIKDPEHVTVEGEIEPMESEPGVIY